MNDDVSVIPSSGCNVISNSSTIYNYSSNVRKTYIQIGGKWYYTQSSDYYSIPSGYQCVDVSSINSKAEFYPVYVLIAFILAVFVWWFVWRLVRPLLRFKV